jgi:hypothetical protein
MQVAKQNRKNVKKQYVHYYSDFTELIIETAVASLFVAFVCTCDEVKTTE